MQSYVRHNFDMTRPFIIITRLEDTLEVVDGEGSFHVHCCQSQVLSRNMVLGSLVTYTGRAGHQRRRSCGWCGMLFVLRPVVGWILLDWIIWEMVWWDEEELYRVIQGKEYLPGSPPWRAALRLLYVSYGFGMDGASGCLWNALPLGTVLKWGMLLTWGEHYDIFE